MSEEMKNTSGEYSADSIQVLEVVEAVRRSERTGTSGTVAEFLSTGNRQLGQIADDEVHAGLYRSTQRNRRGRRR